MDSVGKKDRVGIWSLLHDFERVLWGKGQKIEIQEPKVDLKPSDVEVGVITEDAGEDLILRRFLSLVGEKIGSHDFDEASLMRETLWVFLKFRFREEIKKKRIKESDLVGEERHFAIRRGWRVVVAEVNPKITGANKGVFSLQLVGPNGQPLVIRFR
ncbi:MAG: hypothetical protein NUV53_04795 [Patescibacteria group bacterium]|nr:hypothetical protein [Patescibacteria group bacterium]